MRKKSRRTLLIICILILGLCAALIWVTIQNGTGIDSNTKIVRSVETNIGSTKETKSYEFIPGKSLWDWLQLLVVPVALTGVGLWFSLVQKRTELEIAKDNQCDAMLQTYFDRMSDLLEKGLLSSQRFDASAIIARTRTLTVLPRLDEQRKAQVMQFLLESGLLRRDSAVVSLEVANFEKVNLKRFGFQKADLTGINFKEAILDDTYMKEAHLQWAKLQKASLKEAILGEANLERSVLDEAILTGAQLQKASLKEASLKYSHLEGASLVGANLFRADLTGANLNGADLEQADLRETKITQEQLNMAKSTSGAILPDGLLHLTNE